MRSTEELQQLITNALVEFSERGMPSDPLHEPMRYLLGLPAKRSRPLLLLLAYQAYSEGPVEAALPVALSVECFHNFTLMHDDIMDRAPTRRGQPTVHTKWNENVAILSGDALFAESYGLLAAAFPSRAAQLVRTFTQVAVEVCQGQMDDLIFESRADDVSMEEYLEMIRLKTSVLLGGSLRLGAEAAGATLEDADRLDQFGQLVGMAFQLQDDYMDTYADPKKFGKQPGGDILQNKKTCLWVYTATYGTEAQKDKLRHWAGVSDQPEAKVATVRALFDEVGAGVYCQSLQQQYYERALATIQPLLTNPALQPLVHYLEWMMQRES